MLTSSAVSNTMRTSTSSAAAIIPRPIAALAVLAVCALTANLAAAQGNAVVRQSPDDAWWTGPMLANSAATLPRGHFLIEPYLYDVHAARSNSYGTRSYILYGLANRLTVGGIPIAAFNTVSGASSSSRVGLCDPTVLAQVRLVQFHEGSWIPTMSIMVQEGLPTAKYDQLGNRPSDGFGSGSHTTTIGLNTQRNFWLRNGRILRMRLNLSEALSSPVTVEDVSVYGTGPGFRGRANPGTSFFADAAGEYSLTKRWVLALDVTRGHDGNTRVTGSDAQTPNVLLNSGSRDAFGFAPAVEYSWKPTLGVLLGARVIVAGHGTAATFTPALAINFVR